MRLFGWTIAFKKTEQKVLQPVGNRGGWLALIREPWTGAWQKNITISVDTALTYSAVFRCISLIASDIAKMRVKLVRLTDHGVWQETVNPAFSPVLRRPNRWQTHNQFFANWMESKLIHGNAFILKGRDNRNVATSLHVLDPTRVTVLVPRIAACSTSSAAMTSPDFSKRPLLSRRVKSFTTE